MRIMWHVMIYKYSTDILSIRNTSLKIVLMIQLFFDSTTSEKCQRIRQKGGNQMHLETVDDGLYERGTIY